MKHSSIGPLSLLILMLCPLSFLFAAEAVTVEKNLTFINISGKIDYIEDAEKKLTLAGIIRNKHLKWKKSAGETFKK